MRLIHLDICKAAVVAGPLAFAITGCQSNTYTETIKSPMPVSAVVAKKVPSEIAALEPVLADPTFEAGSQIAQYKVSMPFDQAYANLQHELYPRGWSPALLQENSREKSASFHGDKTHKSYRLFLRKSSGKVELWISNPSSKTP